MKKKTKYIITILIGIVSFVVGFCLYFFIPLTSSNDNISNEEINNAVNLSTMLKITVDNLDIMNNNQEIIGQATMGEIYEVTALERENDTITYTIIYNDDIAFITIPKAKNKTSIEIYNEERQEKKEEKEKVTITTNKNTLSISAEKEYYCESGYTLDSDNCLKTVTKDAQSKETIECAGDYDAFRDQCNVYPSYSANEEATKYCTDNNLSDREVCCGAINGTYNANDSKWCTKTVHKVITPKRITTYSCEKGWTLNGTSCEQTTTIKAKYKYICPSGYTLLNDECIKNN